MTTIATVTASIGAFEEAGIALDLLSVTHFIDKDGVLVGTVNLIGVQRCAQFLDPVIEKLKVTDNPFVLVASTDDKNYRTKLKEQYPWAFIFSQSIPSSNTDLGGHIAAVDEVLTVGEDLLIEERRQWALSPHSNPYRLENNLAGSFSH